MVFFFFREICTNMTKNIKDFKNLWTYGGISLEGIIWQLCFEGLKLSTSMPGC